MQNTASFVEISEDMLSALQQLQLPDEDDAEESGDEARQLLRWLNNLPSIESPLEEWLEESSPEQALAKATNLSKLVKLFIRKVKRARRKRADILTDMSVENAAHAAAALTQAVIEYTLTALPENHPLDAALETLPPQAEQRQTQSVKRLVELVASGIDIASGKNISGKSAPERLVELSVRIGQTARKLRSIDTLEPPAREESIELAREILRKLKNLGFSDKPIKEMIDAGRPEEKAAFAEAIDEMADMYKNLLHEAAEINPNIMQDQRVRDASAAISVFEHSVKLMAAKEMPSSIAAAQQISADATHNPEEWGQLHDRTVGRLVKSMEGALEKAVGDIQAEQEQQRQDDEQAQQQAEAALQQSDQQSRRKKRRKRRSGGGSHRSGGGSKKQQKEKMGHESEDYVLKKGHFDRDAKSARADAMAPMPGLTPEALAAVRQLGGTLLNLGNQAKDLSAALAAAPSTDNKIAPDDKTAAQRIIDEQQRNPKGQGPRV